MVLIEIQGTNCINLLVYHIRQFKVDLMVVATGMASDDSGLLGKYYILR